ncbi:lipid IV(A) palmitoyltransferase PagP [Legionella londiniensis]|uniref:Palmitoyl transferase n=1 Tax=Legionella londiniensis TaxID=45068 RepID=A0A0W0VHH8_9GAMM|nr:lipid IV(A) palmitoyltransferase PagP [Legionella londiniensis]KTD19571.1 palmitoyl transferase [Legionella londiniensis]STX92206.1 Rcp [Legionella londiniensis]
MKKIFFFFCILGVKTVFAAQPTKPCEHWSHLLKPACQRLHQIWSEGSLDLYVTGYAWHNRYTYPPEKIAAYNEAAWGGGLGKSLYDERGNLHTLYAFAFLDSHKKIEPAAGYAYIKTLPLNPDTHVGLGASLFITARSDMFNYHPFPGLLPWATFTHKRATLAATYIPGAQGAGNVLFILSKWRL